MARHVQLLLRETVENLGIVGDIVRVRTGYARNYLLPHQLAETPTPSRIEALKEARAQAQAELARVRSARQEMLGRMKDVRISLVRSCNDKGILYGSVTQRDIADALLEKGYDVGTRSVRLAAALRRVGEYTVPVQFERDLRTEIIVAVEPDQPLEEREEMDFDNEGNLIERPKRKAKAAAKGEVEEPEEAAAG
jgi:large subunit ribosomal protein L9